MFSKKRRTILKKAGLSDCYLTKPGAWTVMGIINYIPANLFKNIPLN